MPPMMPPPPPPMHGGMRKQNSGTLPPHVARALEEKGLSVKGLVFCCRGDMDNDNCYCDSWLFFDSKGIYIICGKEDAERPKGHRKMPHVSVQIDTIRAIPIDDADSLKIEQYVSTGRLIMEKDGEDESLVCFSLGLAGGFDSFANAFNTYKETGEYVYHPDEGMHEGKCKKCGRPCPPGQEYCRKHSKSASTFLRLMKFFGGHIWQIIIILIVMIAESAVSVYLPQLSTRSLYDDVLANPDGLIQSELIKALGTLVLSIIGIKFLQVLFTSFENYLTGSIMPRVMFTLKTKIFNSMQRLSVGFYSSKQTGSLMDRILRDATNIYNFFVDGLPKVIINLATLTGVLAIMFTMSVKLTLIILIAVPFVIAVLMIGDRVFHSMHHRDWRYRAKLSSMVSDNINGQREIKAFARENDEYTRFAEASDEMRKAELSIALTEATLFPMLETIISVLSTVVLGVGGVMVAKGEITTGVLLSYIVYLEMIREPFRFLAWVTNWWARCADSAQRVFEVCDAVPDITEKENAVHIENMRGEVELKELIFEYEPARPVIHKMNLHVAAGDMLGIVGKTGAGKTTIANLIARLYDAKEGNVFIDGVDVKDLKLADIRKNVGLVSQDIYLFIGTIADNIRYAKPDATMDEVIAAAKAASAHDFIMKLPDAYETRVGSGGQKLSGGERQRISIARTIIQNPKILILDEATAAMDTETERRIQHSLSMLKEGRTTIAIAHRLSTLRDSDYLAVIDSGKLVEYGTYQELLKQKGEFYRQYRIQSEALKTIGIGDTEYMPEEEGAEEE